MSGWGPAPATELRLPPDGPPWQIFGGRDDIPAALITFYEVTFGYGVGSCFSITMSQFDANNYWYEIFLVNQGSVPPNCPTLVSGAVTAGTIFHHEAKAGFPSNIQHLVANSPTATAVNIVYGSGTFFNLTTGCGFTIDGNEQARGIIGTAESALATVQSVSSTTQVAALTTPTLTFRNGRAYEFELTGFQTSGTAQGVRYQVHYDNAAGALIGDFGDKPLVSTTSLGEGIYGKSWARNVTGADITTHAACLTMGLQAGVATANLVSRNSVPCVLHVRDCGTSTQFANARNLT